MCTPVETQACCAMPTVFYAAFSALIDMLSSYSTGRDAAGKNRAEQLWKPKSSRPCKRRGGTTADERLSSTRSLKFGFGAILRMWKVNLDGIERSRHFANGFKKMASSNRGHLNRPDPRKLSMPFYAPSARHDHQPSTGRWLRKSDCLAARTRLLRNSEPPCGDGFRWSEGLPKSPIRTWGF